MGAGSSNAGTLDGGVPQPKQFRVVLFVLVVARDELRFPDVVTQRRGGAPHHPIQHRAAHKDRAPAPAV